MTISPWRAISLAGLLAVAPARADDSSISCDGGSVAVGDSKAELLGKCGEPAMRDPALQEREGFDGRRVTLTVDQWTYNFGPNRFMYVVTVESGRVVRIQRGGYGYAAPQPQRRADEPRCDSSAIAVGDLKIDLLARCGEPTTRDVRREDRVVTGAVRGGATAAQFASVEVETWTYDLGPHRFMVIATLQDGKVVAVDHGGYGFRR